MQRYLSDNTVSFQHPRHQTRTNGVSAAQRRLCCSNGRIRSTWWAMKEREASGNLGKLALARTKILEVSMQTLQKAVRFCFGEVEQF